MSDRIFVATRKGLFELRRSQGRWRIAQTSFLGDPVSLVAKSPTDGTLYAALHLGHFGVKLRGSSDGGQRWDELTAPAFPKQPEGVEDKLPDGKPWPWRVEQIWSLEAVDGSLWCGTVGGGLFRSRDRGQSWELNRGLWDHPLRKQWFGGGTDLPGIHSICPHPKNPNELVVGVSCGGAWRTLDGGEHWEPTLGMFAAYMPPELRENPAIQDPHMVARCAAHPDRLWVQHHNGVFRSDDAGNRWVSIPESAPSVFGFAIAAHPVQPGHRLARPRHQGRAALPRGRPRRRLTHARRRPHLGGAARGASPGARLRSHPAPRARRGLHRRAARVRQYHRLALGLRERRRLLDAPLGAPSSGLRRPLRLSPSIRGRSR